MDDGTMLLEPEYSLVEAAILSQTWLSGASLPDVLARPALVTAPAGSGVRPLQRVVIRKRGSGFSVEIQASNQTPRCFLKSVEEIVNLLALSPGWNSYSAKPIGQQSVVAAIKLLAEFLELESPSPVVVPTVQGGIQLEWHTKGINLEVYVDSPGKISFFAEEIRSGESSEKILAGHEPELRSWIQRISGK